jgi:diguanylate cyclase
VLAKLWRFYLVGVAAVAAAYFLIPNTTWSKLVLYNGIGLSAVIANFAGQRVHRPRNVFAWRMIAFGQASFLTADIVYYLLEAFRDTTPFPSMADGFYLMMYPLVIVGLLQLHRDVSRRRDWASVVDAGLVAVATFATLGVLVMDAYITDHSLNVAGRVISLAYPVMDVALLTVAARLIGAVHLRHSSFAFLAAGLCSLFVADTIYGVLNSAGAFQTGGVADAFWIAFYGLVGAAALHPAMGRPVQPRDVNGRLTKPRLFVLCLVVLTVPIIDLGWGKPYDKVLTVGASMVMFLLVLARLLGLVRVIQDNEQQARHDAHHDSLTGLANRALFAERVTQFVHQRRHGVVSVLFIDLDDFKYINDSLGHQAGDELLVAVADRLRQCVRDVDVVARLSGDEFAVLLESAVDRQDAIAVAERVRDSLATPISLSYRDVTISASVGIAVERRTDIERPDALLRAADVAMYRAKSKGKGRFEFFERDMHLEAIERLDLKTDLQSALERGQFELYYQPVVRLGGSRDRANVEALIRWNHPTRGLVDPERFIGLAEQTGAIVPIGRWVLHEACGQLVRWRAQYPTTAPKGVSVNLSVRQLHDPKLLEDVADALSASRLEPQALTLEITESMLIEETDRGSRALEQLKAMQVKISIDDFGTGYSSLSYLRRFPVDTIKIDRSFVEEMAVSPTSEALVRAVVDLSQSLGVTTVAEGIETAEQLAALERLGCTYGQGFFLSPPMRRQDYERIFKEDGRAARRAASSALEAQVLVGAAAFDDIVADIGVLHSDLATPITARSRWMQTWAMTKPEWEPMVFVVRDPRTGRIDAASMLANRYHGGLREYVAMGHDSSGTTHFAARSVRAGRYLAKAIVEHITERDEPWRMHLQQMPDGEPVARLLAQQLPNAELVADQWVPKVRFGENPNIEQFLSRNMRRQLRKAENRLAEDGHSTTLQIERTEYEIVTLLPQLESIHLERDHATRDASDLDDAAARTLWRNLVFAHAAAGRVEIGCLRIDGQIAAYVIAMIDDHAYRVFDGHFDSRFARYSPGRLVETAMLERAIADARFDELDWMAGVAAEKILTANANDARVQLLASSGVAQATISSAALVRL